MPLSLSLNDILVLTYLDDLDNATLKGLHRLMSADGCAIGNTSDTETALNSLASAGLAKYDTDWDWQVTDAGTGFVLGLAWAQRQKTAN